MDYAKSKGYSDLKYIQDSTIQDTIVYIVSYHLTDGNINSQYNYGLKSKMFNPNIIFNYIENINVWIS